MKKQLHRAAAILLLLCFGTSASLYLFFDAARLECKFEAHGQITERAHLQTLKLTLQEFRSGKTDELWHNGALYDVRSYEIKGDTVYASVYRDGQEEELIKTIADSFDPNAKLGVNDMVHLGKHRVHAMGDDGKVLVSPYKMPLLFTFSNVHFPLPYFVQQASASCASVIKPPPRAYTI